MKTDNWTQETTTTQYITVTLHYVDEVLYIRNLLSKVIAVLVKCVHLCMN